MAHIYVGVVALLIRSIAALALLIGVSGSLPEMANAASLVQNGNFVGAKYDTGPNAGTIVPTPYPFTSHTYLQEFAWQNSGSDLAWIANNGSQVIDFAPANPSGYTGNVYVADAEAPNNASTYLMQQIFGLTPGSQYTVSFQQAMGSYFDQGDKAARWEVGLGGAVNYVQTDSLNNLYAWVLSGASTQYSSLMNGNTQSGGISPWQTQSLTFTANSSSELLTFFASGSGAPPFALLADVSMASATPEPAIWVYMMAGFGLIGFALRRHNKSQALVG
ncbi:MAG: PEPxxWA-CTERM sorting domain-containing protein [Novosphingobium sp.]